MREAGSEIDRLDEELRVAYARIESLEELLRGTFHEWEVTTQDHEILVCSPVGQAPGGMHVSEEDRPLAQRLLYYLGKAIIEYRKKCEPFLPRTTTS